MSYGSASQAKAAAPKPRSGGGGRIREPGEGCRAEAAQRRRRAGRFAVSTSSKLSGEGSKCAHARAPHRFSFQEVSEVASGPPFAPIARVAGAKRFVYVLKNGETEPRYYVGVTSDVSARLAWHNAGRCPHTAKHRPWRLHVATEFSDEEHALRFERYLKSGSGRSFARRHFD
ncbi:MAG TPA: GIY-YIG nuclease family protein [Vicinamibacterales bacterium]|nr:GIY-YIG nuclease family protein [Vicinamibacterales bacterium]